MILIRGSSILAICLQSRKTRNEGPARHPFVTDSVESISSLGSRRKRYWVGLFSNGFFLSWVLPIKPHLYRYENWRRTKRFTLFYVRMDYLYPSYFLFINDNNVLYYLLLLNNYEQRRYTALVEVMIESDRVRKKSAGQKQTFHRVSGRLNTA